MAKLKHEAPVLKTVGKTGTEMTALLQALRPRDRTGIEMIDALQALNPNKNVLDIAIATLTK